MFSFGFFFFPFISALSLGLIDEEDVRAMLDGGGGSSRKFVGDK